MNAPTPFELQLWDADDCAAYFKVTTETFMRKHRFTKDFPAPTEMSSTRAQPRWSALAVAKHAVR